MAEYKIDSRGNAGINIRELYRFRELILIFTWRDLKLKYRQTLLGLAWVILQPLILMSIFTVIFSTRIDISTTQVPYTIFVFGGLVIWGLFSNGVSNGSMSVLNQAHVIKKTYFPIVILPIATFLVSVVDFIAALILFLVLILIYDIPVDYLRFAMFMAMAFTLAAIPTLGFSLLFSALNVRYRDIKFIIPFFLQITLFISPIIYPLRIIDNPTIAKILEYNPLSGSIEMARAAVDTSMQPDLLFFLPGLAVSVVLLGIGVLVFGSVQKNFADIA